MSTVNTYKLSQTYKDEYTTWRDDKNLQAAKRQEYLRRNPDAIKDYDLQRVRILLKAVDMMDKSVALNSSKIGLAYETVTSLGLGYAAIGGTTLGFLIRKLGFVKKAIDKFAQKNPKSKNIVTMAITSVSGVLGVLAAYPIYNHLSNLGSNIHRKRKFDTIEKELQDPRIFVVLNDEQKNVFKKNLVKNRQDNPESKSKKSLTKEMNSFKQIAEEALYFNKKQAQLEEKYKEDVSFYEADLNEKEIKDAKKDKVLLSVLIKELNTSAQSYTEKMQSISDNLITVSFALSSLLTLGYESVAKKLKLKSSSIPANLGVFMIIASTFFATWAQKRASHVGKFKAKQNLMQNPEQLVYISKSKTDLIDDSEINLEKPVKTGVLDFLKDFFKHNEEYKNWKKSASLSSNDILKAMEGINISEEQIKEGKRLQNNLFKTLYKMDKNTQNYSNGIDVISESVKYPANIVLGTIGSVLGMKHLTNIRKSVKPLEVFKHSLKYLGTIALFTIPLTIINNYFAKIKKMGARVSDMTTLKELRDYRFFADYSRFKEESISP